MQKITYTLISLLLLSAPLLVGAQPSSPSTDAASADAASADVASAAENAANAAENADGKTLPPVADQTEITRALQDNLLFERQRRQLTNELALAKLRAELQKIRSDSTPADMPAPSAQAPSAEPENTMPSAPVEQPPQILLTSQVAGVPRVAISVNGALRLVAPRTVFSAAGKHWRVVSDKQKGYTLQEVQ